MSDFVQPSAAEQGDLRTHDARFSDPEQITIWTQARNFVARCGVGLAALAPAVSPVWHDVPAEELFPPAVQSFADPYIAADPGNVRRAVRAAMAELDLAQDLMQSQVHFESSALEAYATSLVRLCRWFRCGVVDDVEALTQGLRLHRLEYERSISSYREWLAFARCLDPEAPEFSVPERFVLRETESPPEAPLWDRHATRVAGALRDFYRGRSADSDRT